MNTNQNPLKPDPPKKRNRPVTAHNRPNKTTMLSSVTASASVRPKFFKNQLSSMQKSLSNNSQKNLSTMSCFKPKYYKIPTSDKNKNEDLEESPLEK